MTYPGKDNVQIFDEEDRVAPLHPVYVIPTAAAESMMEYCDNEERFERAGGEGISRFAF